MLQLFLYRSNVFFYQLSFPIAFLYPSIVFTVQFFSFYRFFQSLFLSSFIVCLLGSFLLQLTRFPFTRFPFACSPFQLLSVSFYCLDYCLDSVLFPSFFTRSFSPLIAYIPIDYLFSFHVIPTTSSNAAFSLFCFLFSLLY